MSTENVDPAGEKGKPAEGGEAELRQILGDDYDAVVSKPAEGAAPPPEGAPAAPPAAEPQVGEGTPAPPTTKGMTAEEAEQWARQIQAELQQDIENSSDPVPRTPGLEGHNVQPVHFGQLDEGGQRQEGSIDLLLDVKLPISVELGRTEMLVKEILECGPGTVIELNKLAGEPVDIFINGRMIAKGEVVVVEEHFGVRVTNLLSPRDRVRSLA